MYEFKFKQQMEKLSIHHGRTLDVAEYEQHIQAFNEVENEMLTYSNSEEVRNNTFLLSQRKQRYWAEFVNFIFAANDHMNPEGKKAPVILFGDGKFKGGTC